MVIDVSEEPDTPLFRFQVFLDYLHDGGGSRKLLREVGDYIPIYTASYP
jgi:hypothetical protein